MGPIPRSGRLPGGGKENPLQYSCLENPMNRGAWWATVHSFTDSWTQLRRLSIHTCMYFWILTRINNANPYWWSSHILSTVRWTQLNDFSYSSQEHITITVRCNNERFRIKSDWTIWLLRVLKFLTAGKKTFPSAYGAFWETYSFSFKYF